MDEVLTVFETVPYKTVHAPGQKDVNIITAGGEKKHFTTVLAVNAAGKYLPLDDALNMPFKDRLRQKWILFIQENAKTEAMKLKAPTHQNVIGWVYEAQTEVQNDSDIISEVFNKMTGISNALSGMEDHMIHNPAILGTDDILDSGRMTFKSQKTPFMTWFRIIVGKLPKFCETLGLTWNKMYQVMRNVFDTCKQQKHRSPCTSAQSDQRIY